MEVGRQEDRSEESLAREQSYSAPISPGRSIRPVRPFSPEDIYGRIVPDLTRRIVAAIKPVRVILFGSAGRGELGPDSDLDILVVVRDDVDQNQASKDIYRSLRGFGFATDVLVVSVGDLALYGQDPWLVYRQALVEGRELYGGAS